MLEIIHLILFSNILMQVNILESKITPGFVFDFDQL